MAVYKCTINSIEANVNGQLYADCSIQVKISSNPDVWQPAVNGHKTIVLAATQVKAIYNDTGLTNPQKRSAIKDLIKTQALATGVDVADEALSDFNSLFKDSNALPQDVVIRDV